MGLEAAFPTGPSLGETVKGMQSMSPVASRMGAPVGILAGSCLLPTLPSWPQRAGTPAGTWVGDGSGGWAHRYTFCSFTSKICKV